MTLYGVYGASGCGRGVLPMVRTMLAAPGEASSHALVFVDDGRVTGLVNGYRVLSYQEFLDADATDKRVVLAVAQPAVRERLANACARDGLRFFSARADNIVVMDDVQIGEGAIVSPFVTFTSNIRIGRHFHANLYSYVEHDCRIGDFVTFAPGVRCNGNVHIDDHAYIGSGAVIRQGTPGRPLTIGRAAVVGMGAVVTRDVAPGVTVVGNPAKPLEKGPAAC